MSGLSPVLSRPDGGRGESSPLRILLIAPFFDATSVSEKWSTYQWVRGISERFQVQVLTTHAPGWVAETSPIAATTRIVNWPDPQLPRLLERFNYELKPTYVLFHFRARQWLKQQLRAGQRYDLVHQLNPIALRYPSPARGLGQKLVIGPLAGSLPTPDAFRDEFNEGHWFRHLRSIDRLRLRHDGALRNSYADAHLLLGVAPYVRELLRDVPLRRFEVMSETGVERVAPAPRVARPEGHPLRLLFVGRVTRTKGILEAVRALALASSHVNVRLDVVGDGDLMERCRAEAAQLNVADRVLLHGRQSRTEVQRWYEGSDVFLFPSFREPSGNVIFEALSHGLPVIAAGAGGPGYVVDATCGRSVPITTPAQFTQGLAAAITEFARDRALYERLSAGALERVSSLGLWTTKLDRLSGWYHEVAGRSPAWQRDGLRAGS